MELWVYFAVSKLKATFLHKITVLLKQKERARASLVCVLCVCALCVCVCVCALCVCYVCYVCLVCVHVCVCMYGYFACALCVCACKFRCRVPLVDLRHTKRTPTIISTHFVYCSRLRRRRLAVFVYDVGSLRCNICRRIWQPEIYNSNSHLRTKEQETGLAFETGLSPSP